MVEKNSLENNQIKKERFEFVFSINGNTICQRYFRINNFVEKSLGSTTLNDAIMYCVRLIDNDLKAKTDIYLKYTSPQVFKDVEQMRKWEKNQTFKLDAPTVIVLDESDDVYVWNGREVVSYDKPFFKTDYAKPVNNTTPAIFKFAFFDNEREISSYTWNANVYPRFVRSNIDISNSKNKYADNENYSPVEEFIVDKYINSLPDLIPQIVREICVACSDDKEDYVNTINYGGKSYNIDIAGQRRKYVRDYENYFRKKTNAYFNQN